MGSGTAQRQPETPLHVYLADMVGALQAGYRHSALALALALPDICGSIEYPDVSQVGERYRKWCDEWGQILTLRGGDYYAMRCAYLHNGQDEFSGKSAKLAMFKGIQFTAGTVGGGWVSKVLPPSTPDAKSVVRTPVEDICREMATSADGWYRLRKDDPRVVAAVADLMWIHPAEGPA